MCYVYFILFLLLLLLRFRCRLLVENQNKITTKNDSKNLLYTQTTTLQGCRQHNRAEQSGMRKRGTHQLNSIYTHALLIHTHTLKHTTTTRVSFLFLYYYDIVGCFDLTGCLFCAFVSFEILFVWRLFKRRITRWLIRGVKGR